MWSHRCKRMIFGLFWHISCPASTSQTRFAPPYLHSLWLCFHRLCVYAANDDGKRGSAVLKSRCVHAKTGCSKVCYSLPTGGKTWISSPEPGRQCSKISLVPMLGNWFNMFLCGYIGFSPNILNSNIKQASFYWCCSLPTAARLKLHCGVFLLQ